MIWVTWRQHRTETLVLTGIVAAVGLILVVLGLPMHGLFPDGAAACANADLTTGDPCALALAKLRAKYDYTTTLSLLLNLIPFGIGAFLGAPLLAREMEAGTWQLAWTQAVPRMRWLAVKLGALAGLTVALTAAFSAIISWYRIPLDVFEGRLGGVAYEVEGVVPVAYGLFAFALATAAGVLLRRSIGGLAVAMVVFVATRIAVAGFARPEFAKAQVLVEAIPERGPGVQIGTDNTTDWVLGQTFLDSSGHELSETTLNDLGGDAADAGVNIMTYMHSKGIQRAVTYHPGDRFWDFQLIEAGLFIGAAALLVALVVWRVRRRSP
ncbi:MAG TPA: hypothetical protein VFC19_40220 [Candidatus Limnocylindrales bacterium]|nr:hypothetical protein [Candidatus Limnocylindrales bacterium]